MSTISLCMIVKDEESVIERCLKSIKKLTDEIIIIDTGSKDKTKEICKKYTNNIYDYKWCDDFSKARNYSFSKATCDYIMWLDADDVVPTKTVNELIKLKPNLSADTYMLKYDMGFINKKPTFSFFRERILKNCILAKWNGCVHECITPFGKIEQLELSIEHHKIKYNNYNRNFNIYKTILKERSLSPRELYYYGRELFDHKKYNKCISILRKFINLNDGCIENIIDANFIISNCYEVLNQPNKQLEYLLNTFKLSAPRANVCCKIGDYFLNNKQYLLSIYWYNVAISCKNKTQNYGFTHSMYFDYYPYLQLCVAYYNIQDYEKSIEYNKLAHSIHPSKITIDNAKFLKNIIKP